MIEYTETESRTAVSRGRLEGGKKSYLHKECRISLLQDEKSPGDVVATAAQQRECLSRHGVQL